MNPNIADTLSGRARGHPVAPAGAGPALDIGKFLADLEWWFTLQGISGVEEAQAELLKGYLGDRNDDPIIAERLARAKLFHALILTTITIRRIPIYKREWSSRTEQLIERAAQVLQNTIEV